MVCVRKFLSFTLAGCMSVFAMATNGMESHTKLWSVGTVIGLVSPDSQVKYYLEPQLRLIDDKYKFNQFLFLGGLGYQFNSDVMVFVGPGWVVSKNPQGKVFHEYRIWQQVMWRAYLSPNLVINSRTRLEERRNLDAPQLAYRLRERVWARIPLQHWSGHSLSMFDEMFFNLNHPQWVSPYLFEQNRAFVGVGTQMSKSTVIDVGYLNQYIHNRVNRLDHVLLLNVTMIS